MALTQNFSENENQNHADEETRLLRSASHTGIAHDTNRETSCHTSETDGQTSTELDEPRVEGIVLLLQVVGDQNGHDQSVDTDDTSHNDGDDVC